MTMKDGIRVGNTKNANMKLDMQLDNCKLNGKFMGNQAVLSFNMNMEAVFNFTMQDTVFYLFGKRVQLKNTKIVDNKLNIKTDENLDMIL